MIPFVLIDGALVNVQFIIRAYLGSIKDEDGHLICDYDGNLIARVTLVLSDGSTVPTQFESIDEFMFAYQGWMKSMVSSGFAMTGEFLEEQGLGDLFKGLEEL